MEENHAFVGTDDIIQDGSLNSCRTTMNDQLLVENDNLNIATMSDFQFSESLDALIDIPYTENVTTTQFPTSHDVPTCFDVDETSLTKPPVVSQQEQQQLPVTVHDNSYSSFTGISSGYNSLQQQQQSTTVSNPFFPNMMMPGLGFDPNTFLTTTAATTQNNNSNFVTMPYAAVSVMPPLTLQQSIEAFGQSLASQNQNHVYPLPSMTSFTNVMCAPPPPQQQVSNSFSMIPMVGSNMSLGGVSSSTTARKRGHNSTFPISEDESDFRKRKSDRNAREQQRAQQVTDQIAHLRELITRSGVALDKEIGRAHV